MLDANNPSPRMSEKQIYRSNEIMLADAFSNWLCKQARIFSTWVIMFLITLGTLGLMILVFVLNLIPSRWRTASQKTT